MKRALKAGRFPNARHREDPARTWVIPVGDLVSAGFSPSSGSAAPTVVGSVPQQSSGQATMPASRAVEDAAVVSERMLSLEAELAIMRALASERQAHIQDLQLALRVVSSKAVA
jgi:hypothetical protein